MIGFQILFITTEINGFQIITKEPKVGGENKIPHLVLFTLLPQNNPVWHQNFF